MSAFWPIMQPSLLWDSFPELRYKIEKGQRAVYQLCKWQIPGGTRVPLWFANVDLARLRLCHWTPTYVMEVAIWSTREVHEVEDMRRSYKRKTPEYFNLWFVWLWQGRRVAKMDSGHWTVLILFLLLQFSFLTRDNSLSMGVSLSLTFSEIFHVTKNNSFVKFIVFPTDA